MRTNRKREEEETGPLGVRSGIWLLVAAALLSLIVLSLVRPKTRDSAVRMTTADRLQSVHAELPADAAKVVRSSVTPPPARPLNPEEAKQLAARVANQKAWELYRCEPFVNLEPAFFAQGCWTWSAVRGRGFGDLEARVEFCADGSLPSADINLLISDRSY